jgi:ribosomal protein L12E/L44/L45/RPP1/RPP2
MSNVHDFEDDSVDEAPKDPVRARMRLLEKEAAELKKQLAEAESVKREMAFIKAGVPMDNPVAKYFVKGYDGEVTPEAIRQAAEEANLIAKAAESAQAKSEADAWSRITKAQRAGETSEPVVDWSTKINQARNQDEVMQILAQARQEAENI